MAEALMEKQFIPLSPEL
ncbi:hypothetical protein CGLO_14681 [Colletotrichum gloeosporioides Cg-14]|uniref:Uncharacterized protein n=1 Tax=Colletotrichum gloeosporioides (strain Cg-14) TaxID=1237896 RepID=T0LD72_COLGC|nr:hypothetical protein CGLO_14681 [Colletotrichum gloeosporioides Cg-14]